MSDLLERLILKKMKTKNKPKKVMMPNFISPRTRPNKEAIIPYEIYNNYSYSEKHVIITLNNMIKKGIIRCIVSKKNNEDVSFYTINDKH
jgi:hypothetical protein